MNIKEFRKAAEVGRGSDYLREQREFQKNSNEFNIKDFRAAAAQGNGSEYLSRTRGVQRSLEDRLADYDNSSDAMKTYLQDRGITRESITEKYEQRLQDQQAREDKWRTRDLFADYEEKSLAAKQAEETKQAARKAVEDHEAKDAERPEVIEWFTNGSLKKKKQKADDAAKAAEVAQTAKDAAYSYYKAASEKSGLDIEAVAEEERKAEAEERKKFYQQQGTTPHDYFAGQRLGRAAMRAETKKNIETQEHERFRTMDPLEIQAEIDAERDRYAELEEEYRKQEQLYYDIGMGSGQKAAAKRMKEIEEELSSVDALISEKEDLFSNVKKAKDNEEAARLMFADQTALAAQEQQAAADYSELVQRRQQLEKDKLLDESAFEQARMVDPNTAQAEEITAANEMIEQYYAKYGSDGSYQRKIEQLDQEIAETSQRHAEASQRLKTAKSLQSAREYNAFMQDEDFDSVLKQSASVDYNQTLTAEEEAVRRAVNQQGYSVAEVVRNADYQRQQQDYILGLNPYPPSETAIETQYVSLVEKYKYMTADEKNIFNYILEKQGMDPAKIYLDTLEESLNARSGFAMAQKWTNGGNYDEGIGKYILAPIAGANQFFEGIASAVTGKERATTPYQYAYQDIDANTHWDALGIGQLAYHGSYTVGNMLPMIAASYITSGAASALGASAQTAATMGGYVGSAAIGLSSGGNAYNQALREGYTEEQAKTYGLLSGASEVIMERVLGGISALGGSGGNKIMDLASKMEKVNAKLMTNKAANTAIRFVSAGLSEGTEEYLQSVLEPVYRNYALAENNEIDLASDEAFESALLGVLTGGIFEASTIISGNKKAQQYGQRIYDLNQAEELYRLAKEQGGKAAALAEVIEYGEFSEQNKQYALGSLAAVLEQNGTAAMQILEGRYRSYTKDVGAATTLTSPYEGITPQQNESAERVSVKTQRDAKADLAAMAIDETVIPNVSINKGIYSVHVRGGVEQSFLDTQNNLTPEQKQEILGNLPDIIKNARYVGSDADIDRPDLIRSDHFETAVELEDGTELIVKLQADELRGDRASAGVSEIDVGEISNVENNQVEERAIEELPRGQWDLRGTEGINNTKKDALSPEIEGRNERTPQEKEDLQYIYESVYKDKIAAEDADMLERMTETANEAFERMRKQTKLTKREQKIAEELVTGKRKVFPEGISEEKKHAMQAYMAGYDAYIRDAKKLSADSKNMEKKAYEVLGVKDNSDQAMVDAQRAAKNRVEEITKEIERLDNAWKFTKSDIQASENLVAGTQTEDTFSANIQKDGVKRRAELMTEKKNLDEALRAVQLAAKQKIRDEVRQLTVNADYWNDSKRAIGYELRSTDRAFRAAIKDDPNAPEIIRYFATSVHKNNADRVRWVNSWNDKLRPFGELFREADQALAMTNQEGKTVTPGEMEEVEMTARVNKVIEKYELDRFITAEGKFKYRQAMEEYNTVMRDALKDAIDRANISLVKNGYAPIDLLENYAPHRGDGKDPLSMLIESYLMQTEDGTILREEVEKMRDELLALERKTKGRRFWESAGMTQIKDDQLNAQLTGTTEYMTPGKKYVANFEHRTGDTTEYNLAKNYDSYIENVSRVIFMTENIQRIRALESELRERNAPENIKKQIAEIRRNEKYTAEEREEKIAEQLKNINVGPEGFINWLHEYGNQLAGKKSHWDRPAEKALGRTAMLKAGQAAGWIARNQIAFNIGSALSNFMAVFQAAGEVSAKSMANAAWDGVRTLKKGDAFAEESDFIVSRKGTERIYKTSFDKIIDAGGWALNAFDEVATNIIARAFYNEGISRGMGHDAALEFSNKRSADLMGDRSLGAMPTVLNSQMMKPLFQYQLENLNFWYHYLSDFPLYKRENAVANRALRRGLSAEEARKYSEDNRATYEEMSESEKRRAAMYLTKETLKASIAIFVGNAIMQALRGRKVTYDPIGELGELFLGEDPLKYTLNILGIEDDHEKEKEKIRNMSIEELSEEELDTFWDGLLGFAAGLYGEIPVAGTMLTGGRYAMASPFQSFDSATEFFEGIKNGDIWKDPEGYIDIVGNLLNPFGGYGQAKKTVKGVASLIRGGEYNNKGELKHAAADGTSAEKGIEAVKNILFGVGSTDQAQEYYEDYKTILNARETEGYKNLKGTGIDQDEYLVIAMGLGSIEDDELTGEEIKKEKIAYIQEHYPEDAAFLVEYLVMSKDEAASFEKVRSTGIQADTFMALLTSDAEDVSRVTKVLGGIDDPKQRDAATREIMSSDLRDAYDKVADYGFGEYNYFAAATAAEGKDSAAAKKAARVKAITALDLRSDQRADLARVFDKEITELDLKYPDVLERYAEIADDAGIKDSKEKAAAFYEYLDEVGYTENQKQDIMMQYSFGSTSADKAAETSEKNKEYAEYGVDVETLAWAENALRNQEGYYDRAKTISGMNITGEQKFALLKNNVRMSGKKAGMYELAEAVGVDYDDFAEHFAGAEEFYGDEGKLRAYLNDQDIDSDTEAVIYMLVTKKHKRFNSTMKSLFAKTGWSESEQAEFYEKYSYK